MANKHSNTEELALDHFAELPADDAAELLARQKKYERMQLLWKRRHWLGKVLLGGLGASLFIAWLIPSQYDSTARLMPPGEESGSSLSALASLAGGGASRALAGIGSLLGGKSSGDLFVGVLQSRTVQDDLVTKFDLRKVYGKKRWDDARDKLKSRTDLSIDKKSEILKVVVTDKNPQRATAMAQEYISEVNYLMAQLNTGSAHRERVFLEDRLQQVQQNLEASEKDFSEFASKNVALDIPAQGKAMMEASSQLEGQLIVAQTELQGLKQIYTDENIRVRSTQARIDELQRQLGKMRGNSATASTDGADDPDSTLYPTIRKLPLLGVNYADLLRRTKVQEAVFEGLTQQYELAKINEAKELPVLKVLDPPDVPEEKSFPPRTIITVVGGLLALGLGIGWIFATERWRQVDPGDPAKSFTKMVLADVVRDLPWVATNGSSDGAIAAWNVPPETPANGNGHEPHGSNGNR